MSAVWVAWWLAVGFAFRSRALHALLRDAPFVGCVHLGCVAATGAQAAVAHV